jgi:TonB-dependent SusC/RagA subfamily outer membrane receptor
VGIALCLQAAGAAQVSGGGQGTPAAPRVPTGTAAGASASSETAPAGVADAPLKRIVSLDLADAPLNEALKEINRQAHLGLAYTPRVVPVDRRVTIKAAKITAGEALERVLRGTGVKAKETPAGTVALVKDEAAAETSAPAELGGVIGGDVTDIASHQPLIGAQVIVQNTSLTAVTNTRGAYEIRGVPAGSQTVMVRLIGYAPAVQAVTVVDSQFTRADFSLATRPTRLTEVVTTATGPRRRLEIANDITTIDVDSVLQAAPVSSVTDLLATRVPGLIVQGTTGAPGDPGRIRIRGVSSIYGTNDPIVIVDGVRIYSAQSDARSANQAAGAFGAPSPLDQLDPHSIETIEVAKGPSAATLYGADAANGVIVITTKKGRPGPARWRVSTSHGLSYMPGQYPDAYLLFGHDYNGDRRICVLGELCGAGVDSLVRFQALNAPDLTVLGHGGTTRLALGVDGGSQGLSYSLTGSFDNETGILKLPTLAATQFGDAQGYGAPDWMQRPQSLRRWSATGSVTAQLGAKMQVAFTTTLTRARQQRSSLEQQLGKLMTTYVDTASKTIYQMGGSGLGFVTTPPVLVPDFYRRITDAATNFTNAANVTWRPLPWLTGSADAGVNVITRNDENLLPRDMLDTLGSLTTARGNSVVSTVNLRATATAPLPMGFRLQFATGANYTKTSISDLQANASGLAPGTTGLSGAGAWGPPSQNVSDVTNLGWYLEPSLAHQRFFLSAGLRFDGGSTYGSQASLPTFPKLGGSWLISDEPWFPLKVSSTRFGSARPTDTPGCNRALSTGSGSTEVRASSSTAGSPA